jgi:thiol-disulfide isomerase/thioredoxin
VSVRKSFIKAGRKTLVRNITQIFIILLAFLAIRVYLTQGTIQSGPAPDFGGQLLDGSSFQLQDFRGKPALVHFWATWCKVCALNDGTIDSLAEDHQVMTVVMESGTKKAVYDEMQKRGLSFPVFYDGAGVLANRYRVKGVPTNFILDSKGNISHVEPGYTTGLGLRIRLWLASFD